MATKNRQTPFQHAHLLQFGLSIVERSPNTAEAVSVCCNFRLKFGREEKKALRRPTSRTLERVSACDKAIGAISDDSSLVVAFSDTEGVLEDLGSFAVETLQNLENEEKQLIFCNVSKCAVNLIASLANIVAEQNSMNQAAEKVPPVLPHQLVTLRGREFASILQNQRSCLSERWTNVQIDAIELDFQALCDAYESEDSLKAALDSCDHITSFETAWNYAQNRFQSLKSFCGGLATAFPGTSSVECDFSIVKWEKNETCFSLSDFSLEGIIACKAIQFAK